LPWLYFAIFAYLFNALAFLIDKYLLVTHIPRPFAYAFWVAILSVSAIVLIPFGVATQSVGYLLISLISGGSFFIALIFLYKAIKTSDISVASTMSGVATAVFSYFLAVPLLGEPTGIINSTAIAMLIVGMFLLGRADKSIWLLAIWAGLFFGISFVFLKMSFDASNFINGLFWTRMGFVGAALVSLVFNPLRKDVIGSFKNTRLRVRAVFVGSKLLAAAGFLLLYYAIRLGTVSVVNSLLGFQFLFIFILALMFKSRIPSLEENIDKRHIVNKIIGIGFVIAGFLIVIA